MILKLIENTASQRLILIFAGWGMDANPFFGLHHPGYDIAVAYDYRSSEPNSDFHIECYDEICIIAWSFGVIAAAGFISANPGLPLTAKIAVNGTLHPVDDRLGIPEAIFNGTLRTLSTASLARFNRRMCGSSARLKECLAHLPERNDIPELADELRAIVAMPHRPDTKATWDTVFIYDNDLIIPTANQHEAWHGHPDIRIMSGSHLPDFQTIINQTIINKTLVAGRFHRATTSYESHASVQREIACRITGMIAKASIGKSPETILEIGSGTGFLTRHIHAMFPDSGLTLWDISPISDELPGLHRQCDAETEIRRIPEKSLGIIASASTIQWFNSPSEFIRQSAKALSDNGLIAIATFGPDNFKELSQYLPTRLRYYCPTQWQTTLESAGFIDITIIETRHTLTFDDSASMLRHIKQTGVNATSPSQVAVRRILASPLHTLTYHPLYILAHKGQ